MASKPAPIVAELGRAETAGETADRKAETTRRHRAGQTTRNLVGATLASLAIVAGLVAVVPRPSPPPADPIDIVAIAAQAQPTASVPLIVPLLPGWDVNDAHFETRAQVPTWYVGFVTPATQFIAFNQGIGANATWQDGLLAGAQRTGSTTIDGRTWDVYDRRTARDPGNLAYAMASTSDGSTVVLHGTAPTEEFEALAAAVAAAGPAQ